MRKYRVCIEETVTDEFTVEASSYEEAVELAEQNYIDCNFVLEPGNVTSRRLSIVTPDSDNKWIEF